MRRLLLYVARLVVNATGTARRGGDVDAWRTSIAGNVMTVSSLIEALLLLDPEDRPAVISIGSQSEYGSAISPWTESQAAAPSTFYGASKSAANVLIAAAAAGGSIVASSVRLPIVFGPAQAPSMLIPELICNSLAGAVTKTTGGEQRRRFVYAPDAARDILALGTRLLQDGAPSVINGRAYPPMLLVDMVKHLSDAMSWPALVDIGALEYRDTEVMDEWPDTTLVESLDLPGELTALDAALAATTAWYKDNERLWKRWR